MNKEKSDIVTDPIVKHEAAYPFWNYCIQWALKGGTAWSGKAWVV